MRATIDAMQVLVLENPAAAQALGGLARQLARLELEPTPAA